MRAGANHSSDCLPLLTLLAGWIAPIMISELAFDPWRYRCKPIIILYPNWHGRLLPARLTFVPINVEPSHEVTP